MKYQSTRGFEKGISFKEVLLNGLAKDGGLYVPEKFEKFTMAQISKFKNLEYYQLAFETTYQFVASDISETAYFEICKKTYSNFSKDKILTINKLEKNEFILNLYHGPTMAFKDFALQLLGNIYDYFLKKDNLRLTIIGATSGDTGSAAIAGCLRSKLVQMFILFPYKKVSEIQRKQMTTIYDPNLHNIAIEGNFDDCQNLVKKMFEMNNKEKKLRLAAVNSINWVRIMGQIVYYFWSYLRCCDSEEEINFSVPTGNFGNVYAGFIAKRMGIPIKKLVVSSNVNDVLTRFFNSGRMEMFKTVKTLSPSMDIQVSSNFERLLFNYFPNEKKGVNKFYKQLKDNGKFLVDKSILNKILKEFCGGKINDLETKQNIKNIYEKYNIIIDPHTSVGICVGRNNISCEEKKIFLATAHYGKFIETIRASLDKDVQLPNSLKSLIKKEEKYEIMSNEIDAIASFVLSKNNF